ncbi:MAG: hypothetical protein AAFY57_18500 [Cyanobacteria bacterium J06642_2]
MKQNKQSRRFWQCQAFASIASLGLAACSQLLNDVAVAPVEGVRGPTDADFVQLLYEDNPAVTTLVDAAIALAVLNGVSESEAVAAAASQLLRSAELTISLSEVPQPADIDFIEPRGTLDVAEIATILSASRFPCPEPPLDFLAATVGNLLGDRVDIEPEDIQSIPGGVTANLDNLPKLPTGSDDELGGCPLGLPVVPGEPFDRTFDRSVGPGDNSDLYQIAIARPVQLTVTIDAPEGGTLLDSIALQVVEDRNGNRAIDTGEIVASSDRPELEPEEIVTQLDAGDYTIQILYPGNPGVLASGTSYQLRVIIEPE